MRGLMLTAQVSQCQAALTNMLQRAWAETEDSARLLEKQQRIEAITASLRASGGSEVICVCSLNFMKGENAVTLSQKSHKMGHYNLSFCINSLQFEIWKGKLFFIFSLLARTSWRRWRRC